MSTDAGELRLARPIADLYATDPQLAAAKPSEEITAAIEQPGLRLPAMIQTVMDGYADRPALGQRAFQFVCDPITGRTSVELLPSFETITYRELSDRVSALASVLTNDPGHSIDHGDRVCVLGFTSVDYTTIDMALLQLGAVSVPLPTGAPVAQLCSIVEETRPRVIAASIEYLADAVELVVAGHTPERVVVFDHHPLVDEQREAFDAARGRLAKAGAPVVVETLDDVLQRGRALPDAPVLSADDDDPLALVVYTAGSTDAPSGAMYTQRLIANFWRRSSTAWFEGAGESSITLSFLPMIHVMGRQVVFGTLGNGGTVYFAAKSDLSTLLDDVALVRPTELNFVPRIWETLYGE
jgi:fatty acid CoA ligase FadD9